MGEQRLMVWQKDGVPKSKPVPTGTSYIKETFRALQDSDGIAYRREWNGLWSELKLDSKCANGYVREPAVKPPDWLLMYLLLTE